MLDLFDIEDDNVDMIINDGNEDIDLPKGHDFIVSIHAWKENCSHCGCGVIVDNCLITAGHVAKNKTTGVLLQEIYVLFKGNFYCLCEKDIIYDGRNTIESIDGIHDDLIIYKFDVEDSPFKLNDKEFEEGLSLYTRIIDYIADVDKLKPSGNSCKIVSLTSKALNDKEKVWLNCFDVNNPLIYKEGNSGCPVYIENIVYGILLKGDADGNNGRIYTVLNANYIKSKIEERRF